MSKDMDMEHNLASGGIRGYGMRLYNVIYCFFLIHNSRVPDTGYVGGGQINEPGVDKNWK